MMFLTPHPAEGAWLFRPTYGRQVAYARPPSARFPPLCSSLPRLLMTGGGPGVGVGDAAD